MKITIIEGTPQELAQYEREQAQKEPTPAEELGWLGTLGLIKHPNL